VIETCFSQPDLGQRGGVEPHQSVDGNHPPAARNLLMKNESFEKNLRMFPLGNFLRDQGALRQESSRSVTFGMMPLGDNASIVLL
jgi:hypothetical protein